VKRFENFEMFTLEQLKNCMISTTFIPDTDNYMASSFEIRAELLIELIRQIWKYKIDNTSKYSFVGFDVSELEEFKNCIIHTTSICDEKTANYRNEMLINIQQQIEAEIEDDPEMQDAAYEGLVQN